MNRSVSRPRAGVRRVLWATLATIVALGCVLFACAVPVGVTAQAVPAGQAAGAWLPLSAAGAPSARYNHGAVWTGTEMLVWGGIGAGDAPAKLGDGARYQPSTDTWTSISGNWAPAPRSGHAALWTGTEMIVAGGAVCPPAKCIGAGPGSSYHPTTDTWTPSPARRPV